MKIEFLLSKLYENGKISYKDLFEEDKEKSSNIATFLAILELVRIGRVELLENDGQIKMRKKEVA